MIRVADYVLKRIHDAGVNHVFYVPGGQCVYLMDAIRRAQENHEVCGIGMHHEQAVAMAALSYATMNETLGAGIVTTGCAGTNTMTGLLHAYQDSLPMIIVSGQQNYEQTVKGSGLPLRQVGVQEADIETIVKPLTKYAVTVEHPEDIAFHLDKALHFATSGRKGPVWIDLPLNVQNAIVNEDNLPRFVPYDAPFPANDSDIEKFKNIYESSSRPVIIVGNGVRSSGAKKELVELSHKMRIPMVFTRLTSDIASYEDEFNFGLIGGVAGANRYANFIVQNSDLVIAVGSRMSIEVTGPARDDFAREAKIVVVDIDRIEHAKKGVKIDLFVNADAKNFISKVSDLELKPADGCWIETCNHWKHIFDYPLTHKDNALIDFKHFMIELSKHSPENTTYLSDAGFTGAAAPAATIIKDGDRFILSLAQGEMGYALPGSVGAAPLSLGPVVSYSGDGSVMMNIQELQTIVRNQFNIKIVINNNNGYSGVRHGQKAHFRGKSIGTDPSNGLDLPSFEKLASAFGIDYLKIENYSDFAKIPQIFKDNKPLVVEVYTDPEQFDLHNGLVMYGKRKFGFRPIEDQSPYVDRDVFFKEMIVKPMDTSSGTPM